MSINKLKKEFIKDYYRVLFKLYKKFEPLLKEGWSQEEVFNLFLFMEKNQDIVKNKDVQEIKNLYLKEKKNKKRRY